MTRTGDDMVVITTWHDDDARDDVTIMVTRNGNMSFEKHQLKGDILKKELYLEKQALTM